MKLLLDTHALLWFSAGDRRLTAAARKAIEADDSTNCISAAVVWEMSIKASLGRLGLSRTVEAFIADKLAEGYEVVPVTWPQAAATERLPFHHRDPFDRLLVAQSLSEGWPIVTRDPMFRAYGVNAIW